MAAASLRALLARSIDYAGLFPPADLALEPALRNYAEYVRVADAWMLGAFILPVAQFEAASARLHPFDAKYPLRVSALGIKTSNIAALLAALETTQTAIHSFSETLSICQLEMPLPSGADSELLRKTRAVLGDVDVNLFLEAAADAAERTIQLIAENNSNQPGFQIDLNSEPAASRRMPFHRRRRLRSLSSRPLNTACR